LHPIFAIDEPMHLQAPEAHKLPDSKAAAPTEESAGTSILRSFYTAWPQNFDYVISGSGVLVRVQFEQEAEASEFAEAFAGVADVYGIAQPGFTEGQKVPADVDALAAARHHHRAQSGYSIAGALATTSACEPALKPSA